MENMQSKINPDEDNHSEDVTEMEQEGEDDQGDQSGLQDAAAAIGLEEEFVMINNQMDQISSVMDMLEQKNNVLQAQLRELLEMNREQRLESDPAVPLSSSEMQYLVGENQSVASQLASIKQQIDDKVSVLDMLRKREEFHDKDGPDGAAPL